MNRQTFEWNTNPFCRLFREANTAYDFIGVFRARTKYDVTTRRIIYALTTDDTMVDDIEMSQQHGDEDEVEDQDQQTSRKRTLEQRESTTEPQHSNPLDDSILAKRIGMIIP